ncbi:hypothetical protein LMG23992_00966 [Cupriavidus laharis]|uniref:DUF3422 domain-containing protein n=1 Tax=Cupriavidus laharis TaxID=151654 RepID=A0ABM8WKP3_9BURK|nr:DUF3422 domain-containing protein [Cupriavidus laharis]CAG9167950.1 hypothetical protein LMG23992_00966 [Cupriavidus laharis]
MDHALRASLASELHARPFLRLSGSVALAHLAIYAGDDTAVHEQLLRALCDLTGMPPPEPGSTHYAAQWNGERQLKWERHTEFSTYTFVARRHDTDYFSGLATEHVPQAWFEQIAGMRFVATRMELVSGGNAPVVRDGYRQWIDGPIKVGSRVLGNGEVYCDWTIKPDGFSRFLVIDEGFREAQGGRLLQRLYEIETYRMMALLALPAARELGRSLDVLQRSLAGLMHRMDSAPDDKVDADLLQELTHLAVRGEALAEAGHRFSASRAYERLVMARIQELREERIEGIPTIAEFMERRFTPAMDTCRANWSRLEQFTTRVARAVDLLRTRVSLAQEGNTMRLLAGMDRTARTQLHLQHAVEGLSVAAISYYVLSLTAVGLRSLHALHLGMDPELVEGLLIAPVVLLVFLVIRRTKRSDKSAKGGASAG